MKLINNEQRVSVFEKKLIYNRGRLTKLSHDELKVLLDFCFQATRICIRMWNSTIV